ncbi:protein kinase [Streptomyces sp. NPDC006285]|uniref:serine/threonine-protein kinase n=1 Tax=Streptomyces sp. NPDC006285 TaxID=3364742 RepID=UPI0036C01510
MRLRESARAVVSRSSTEILGGRYRLDALLGSGGAADVHRGFDLRMRRPVAVKFFRPDTGFDLEENLHSEAVIQARLHHPGLVTAYDTGRHDGRAFLVMQLVEGNTLRDLIAGGPLSPGTTAALGADLAQALAHAHDAGIVHRDVKPSNILLDASRRPYLTDFGISQVLDATTRTATGTLIGTAAYLSPEQVLGRPVGRPADVYALGLVLLECLTGRLEYDGGPLEAAIARLHRRPVVPDGLPGQLTGLLRDMTALDEQTRPTAHDCARVLAASVEAAGEAADGEVGPSVPATSLVVPVGSSRTAGRTHLKPLSHHGRAASRSMPARGRTLVLGASAALVAVMATGLALDDSSTSPGDDRNATRATSAPTVEETDSPDDAGRRRAPATSATAPSSAHDASVGTLSDDASGRGAHPAPGHPNHRSTVDTATTAQAAPVDRGTSAPPSAAPRNGTAPTTPALPPGLSEKTEPAEKAKDQAQQKKVGRTVTDR